MTPVNPESLPPSGGDGGPPADDLSAADPRGGPTVLRMLLGTGLQAARRGWSHPGRGRLRDPRVPVQDQPAGARPGELQIPGRGRPVTLYGVTNEQTRAGLLSLAEQANAQGWWAKYSDILPDWFEAYLGLEAAASLIRSFELQFVHGLFQTQAYARAVTVLGHKAAPAGDRPPGQPADETAGPAAQPGRAAGLVGHGRGRAAPPGGRGPGHARPLAGSSRWPRCLRSR